jgi:type IV pilus assembly protein PilW
MSTKSSHSPLAPWRQSGVTLVELMVGLVIGIVVSLAASALYLATRESSRAAQGHSDINDTGKIALDMIGRELQKAGFYPAQFTTPTDVVHSGRYYNGKAGAKVAFDTGIFGCDGAPYNPATHACATTVAAAPDSVIINYFSSPEFGASSLLGNTNDCNRQAVSADADNTAKAAAGLPLFVSNRFGLVGTSYTDAENNTVTTKSLYCHGNGADTSTTLQPAIQGIEDLVIRYGIGTDGTTQSPSKFLTAANVTAAGTSADGLKPWQRVTAVSVCIVVRSMQNSRLEDKSSTVRSYRNCRGGTTSMPTGDKYLYKSFERIFAIRNNLSAVGTF